MKTIDDMKEFVDYYITKKDKLIEPKTLNIKTIFLIIFLIILCIGIIVILYLAINYIDFIIKFIFGAFIGAFLIVLIALAPW